MSGQLIISIGIGLMAIAVLLFLIGVIYRKTTGKRIREELNREYSAGRD